MVFSGVEGGPEVMDTREMLPGEICQLIGTSTDIDNVRGDTGATLGETGTGT